jgi:hypothetical protein
MNQPNVIPINPENYCILEQKAFELASGGDYLVIVSVYRVDFGYQTLHFTVPISECPKPLTVFKLFRHVDYGWVITKKDNVYYTSSDPI